jgi:hypothetical protein
LGSRTGSFAAKGTREPPPISTGTPTKQKQRPSKTKSQKKMLLLVFFFTCAFGQVIPAPPGTDLPLLVARSRHSSPTGYLSLSLSITSISISSQIPLFAGDSIAISGSGSQSSTFNCDDLFQNSSIFYFFANYTRQSPPNPVVVMTGMTLINCPALFVTDSKAWGIANACSTR